jgi:hypothetical protein
MELIRYLSKEYSKRCITNETDRWVTIYGLEDRMARAKKGQTSYGVFHLYLHRELLWRKSGGGEDEAD